MTTLVTPPVRAARWAPLGVLAGGLAGCAYLAVNDPSDPSTAMPFCPFHAVTGLWCAGCGGLRMVHALLHGRLGQAAQDNLLLLVAAPFLLALLGAWAASSARGQRFRLPVTRWSALALLVLVVAWTVARNLPGFPLQPV
jgi:uncharacterized protein DUF2752